MILFLYKLFHLHSFGRSDPLLMFRNHTFRYLFVSYGFRCWAPASPRLPSTCGFCSRLAQDHVAVRPAERRDHLDARLAAVLPLHAEPAVSAASDASSHS
jgi:hypothetical protein